MKELVKYMVNALVDDNQGVKFSMSEDGGVVRFRISVSSSEPLIQAFSRSLSQRRRKGRPRAAYTSLINSADKR